MPERMGSREVGDGGAALYSISRLGERKEQARVPETEGGCGGLEQEGEGYKKLDWA